MKTLNQWLTAITVGWFAGCVGSVELLIINANVRLCSQCGLAEPDAPKLCTEAPRHDWSY